MEAVIGNAIWLFTALPEWYFSTILAPFSASFLTAIPASGILAMAAAIVLALMRRELNILWALIGVALSHALVVTAGLMRGQLDDNQLVLLLFLAVQLGVAGFTIARTQASRIAGILIGWFNITYALFAAFIAAMSFADSWL